MTSGTPIPDFIDRGYLDGEEDILKRQLRKISLLYNGVEYSIIQTPVMITLCSPRFPLSLTEVTQVQDLNMIIML